MRRVSEYERIVYRYMGVSSAKQSYSDARVMELVNTTADDLAKDAPGTLQAINAGQAPYMDGLYSFVYDTNVTMVVHAANIRLVGVSFRGKTDVAGRACRGPGKRDRMGVICLYKSVQGQPVP